MPGCYICHQTRTGSFGTDAVHTAEYMIDNRTVYDILDQICKDTDLYPYDKQHKSKRDSRGAFYAFIPGGDLNHVNLTASEAKLMLQMSTYDGEINAWN